MATKSTKPAKQETNNEPNDSRPTSRGPSFNQVTLLGNLTRDPELRYTKSGTAVCNFTLACNSYYRKDENLHQDTAFVRCTAWSGLAEVISQHMRKGRTLLLSGRLSSHTWETESGEQRQTLEVTAETVQFIGGKREE